MHDAIADFQAPTSLYRGKPFWAWNGKLDAAELRRQVRVMHRMGLGGFFMHSRVGLATAYLSDQWFAMVRACVEEAKRLGMEAWLYDEDRWPSGAAGGLVTCSHEHRHKNLRMTVCQSPDALPQDGLLAVFSAELDGYTARSVQRLDPDAVRQAAAGRPALLAFTIETDAPSSWYNNATYLDTMSAQAVQRFIQVTHEDYRRRVGDEFGTVVPGIFTDEPNHGNVFAASGPPAGPHTVPWTDGLPDAFRARYGYDLLDHLPHIFLNVDGEKVSKPRWHYHDCKTFLFTDSFSRQIGEWCERNGLLSTGHVLAEDGLVSQSRVGGAAMRFYEHMQAPGIDQLTEHYDEYTTAKQCASVQNQMGRRWMLSELYGCTGWDWPFEGHKAVGDWQAVLGVNLRCQHLSWYTMRGQAKRDYPASISFQSPWWPHYRKVEDYFARIGTVMSRGRPVRELVVVHPVESVWALATPAWADDPDIRRLEEQFRSLILWLLDQHVDFDYADEEMLSRLGSAAAGRLAVGQASYRVVLVPPVHTLRSTTVRLLSELVEAAGTVVFCEPVPGYVDADESDAVARLAARCTTVSFERPAIADAVAPARTVSIREPSGLEKAGVFYLLHREGDELRLLLCNRDRENPTGPLTVEVLAPGHVQRWDAETGRRWAVEAERSETTTRFATDMHPTGSRLFVLCPDPEDLPAHDTLQEVSSSELPADAWSAQLTDHNVLVLDMPEFRLADGEWDGPTEVLKADAEIRARIGLPPRAGQMVQPWARPESDQPGARVNLRYRFTVERTPDAPVFLAMEGPDRFAVTLNGNPIPADADCGWWVDPAIRLLPLDTAALLAGENTLDFQGTIDSDYGLEACFILGGFSVTVDGPKPRIVGPRPDPGLGDWRDQGLPFYGGSVVYRTRVACNIPPDDRLFVQVPVFAGVCVRVLVDGHHAGVIGWPPHEVDITNLVRDKDTTQLAVEVLGHRRNCFGPLHHADDHLPFVGPHSFTTSGDQWQDGYSLVPVGLLAPPRLSIRRPAQ
jgi:hypothetical protein